MQYEGTFAHDFQKVDSLLFLVSFGAMIKVPITMHTTLIAFAKHEKGQKEVRSELPGIHLQG